MASGEPPPPRPAKTSGEVVEAGGVLFVSYRPRSGSGKVLAGFLSFFLLLWSIGCVALAGLVIARQELFVILFALPFWAAWVFVAAMLVNVLFGIERLAVSADGIGYENRVLRTLTRRFIPRAEILAIEASVSSVDSDSGAKSHALGITSAGHKLLFGTGLSVEECRWLAWKIRAWMTFAPAENGLVESAVAPPDAGVSFQERPSDCGWTLEDDGDGLCFRNAGRLKWGSVFVLLFVNVFWNGIVGVFVSVLFGLGPADQPNNAPRGGQWWCLLVFLIPFELIGLGMVVALFAMIADVFRRTACTFRPGEMERVNRWLGIRLARRHEFDADCRLVAREAILPHPASDKADCEKPPEDNRFLLAVLDREGVVVCSIGGLTLGEARWMRAEIAARRPGWFQWGEPPV